MRGCSGLVLALCLLTGCAGAEKPPAPGPSENPRLGGASPTATPPTQAMDDLERPIAARLGKQVAAQGLHVDHLDCPKWDGKVPAEMTCDGWFDNVLGKVLVTLHRDTDGMVAFDAKLQGGLIATKRLVDELLAKGYTDVDCGDTPAYPTEVGSTITCSVTLNGREKLVVATVTDHRGRVRISDF